MKQTKQMKQFEEDLQKLIKERVFSKDLAKKELHISEESFCYLSSEGLIEEAQITNNIRAYRVTDFGNSYFLYKKLKKEINRKSQITSIIIGTLSGFVSSLLIYLFNLWIS